MSWERFNYICRRANAVHQTDEPIGQCLKRVEAEAGTKLYGEAIQKNSLSRDLLNEMAQTTHAKNGRDALQLYASLNLGQWMAKPLQFKRYFSYIYIVGAIYFIVATLYQTKVMPTINDALAQFMNSSELPLSFYHQQWLTVQVCIGLILLISCALSFAYSQLYSFKNNITTRITLKIFASRSLKNSHKNLNDLLRYPLLKHSQPATIQPSTYVSHLIEVDNSGMRLDIEIKALVKAETARLVHSIERHMKLALGISWVTLMAAIFTLLINTYSPIAMLGEAF